MSYVRPKFSCSNLASHQKPKIKVLISVLKSTYVPKSVIIKVTWKYVVVKNKSISNRKIQGEKTSFKAKILALQTKVYEFSKEKFFSFTM